ncbi:hypothetical protein Pst134EA_005477 [Puccinia striiformis f. sp. tritici]|uniref:hypothetical protein n=1 Tax=Puccinia striiformis f. sp. tritici TaxID=168172 RepID=UPI00200836B1|nr:hypothetical protein Pst134EA_005477 [Puccinia striiformis f. sp. tritici]KAH9471585.1 hypothetical protein Pst134EA_005477 [Puccinia striiformis f. sp. tritici]KAI9618912.1 hypothetical protein H4Q26_012167 [Puccinia striiformis f. sp. tritici PST-130]
MFTSITLDIRIISLLLFLVINLILQPPSLTVQGSRWMSKSKLYLQSDSVSDFPNRFMHNFNPHNTDDGADKPSTQGNFVFQRVEIDPNPPKVGQNLTVRATGTIRRLIEDGAYAVVTVNVGLVRLLQKTFDVCEELRKADVSLQCPMEPGDFDIAYEITLPKEIPPVTYRIDALAYTTDDDDMACANLSVDFSRKP